VKFAFVAAQLVAFPVTVICRVLDVSTSGYYAWTERGASCRSRRDRDLGAKVRAAHAASKGRYGSPRVHAELRVAGEKVGRKRIARLMKQAHLEGRKRRRFRKPPTPTIDKFYNLQRRHSTIGYRSPTEFELMNCKESRAA
jgi:putative transposase